MFDWINELRLDDMVYISPRISVSRNSLSWIRLASRSDVITTYPGTNWNSNSESIDFFFGVESEASEGE